VTLELGHILTVAAAAVAFIAWLVRLEGRVNGKATSDQVSTVSGQIGTVAAIVATLQAKEAAHDNTRDEVIRLQEQIKHLTNLIERLLPASRRKVAE
jgi:enamine deaminase RidA (YjgF/YER057c/UK114 family)